MSIASVSSTPDAASAVAQAATSASSADNEQRFLKLLVTQLNNQDPLNPMDNAQLTSQLAQMSTVSGIEKMNATLQTILGQNSSGQMLQAAGMVGRSVLSAGDQFAGGDAPAAFAVKLPASAQSVQAVITDAAGNVVRTLDLGALPSGLNNQVWDGKTDAGAAAPAGIYRVQVTAANGTSPVAATTLVYDQVASVAQSGTTGVTLQLSGGRSIALGDVVEAR